MSPRRVLIVEDHEAQRQALQVGLRNRGFDTHAAKSVAATRDLVQELAGTIDVAVLDMHLEEWPDATGPENVGIKGADIGVEIRERQRAYPPEFLVLTAYPTVENFRAAVRLGIAEFLVKQETPLESSVRHVRALALRRALSMERPDLSERLDGIANNSSDQFELVRSFLNEVLRPELANGLGTPFVLLFTVGDHTYCCGEAEASIEAPQPAYGELQQLIYGAARAEPLTLNVQEFVCEKGRQYEPVLGRFDEAVFLPLTTGEPVRLSLGLLAAPAGTVSPEEAQPLARVLARHFRPAVLEQLLRLSARRRDLIAARKSALAVAAAASRCCLFIGQEQSSIIDGPREEAEPVVEDMRITRLRGLVHDLHEAGGWLATIGREAVGDVQPAEPLQSVPVGAVLQEAWQCLCTASDEEPGLPHIDEATLRLEGDCAVQGNRDDLLYAFTKLLQWFVERLSEEAEPGQAVQVTCEQTERGPQISLEDCSRRLPDHLRQELFMPFAQFLPRRGLEPERKYPSAYLPLYLARMLIEFRNHGMLEDRSADIAGPLGHRFVIRFRA